MSNQAAFTDSAGAPLRIGPAEDRPVGKGEIKIRHRAVAVNPADAKLAATGMLVKTWPMIYGFDVAGEITEVGSEITSFKVGDRVVADLAGLFGPHGLKNTGFQLSSVCSTYGVSKIPDSTTYVDATTFATPLATAATALHHKNALALPLPSSAPSKPNGKLILVWGGSSAVGVTAIQILAHSGYEIITTSSAKHFSQLKSLGAKHTFDYKSSSVIEEIVQLIKGREADYVGAFSAMDTTDPMQATVVAERLNVKTKVVTTTRFDREKVPRNVEAVAIIATQSFPGPPGSDPQPEIGAHFYGPSGWLYAALEGKTLQITPKPRVVGKGLESLQEAMEQMKKGVSFERLVVEL